MKTSPRSLIRFQEKKPQDGIKMNHNTKEEMGGLQNKKSRGENYFSINITVYRICL